MSFNIMLQRNNSEPIRMDKDIYTLGTVSGTLKDPTSIIDPIIRIQYSLSSLKNCNYLTIPEFGRSYFVQNITSLTNNILEVSCHVDVLSSFKNEIRNNVGIVKRQEQLWNLYLNDGSLKVYQNPYIITKEFPSGFSTQEFVLGMAGS